MIVNEKWKYIDENGGAAKSEWKNLHRHTFVILVQAKVTHM